MSRLVDLWIFWPIARVIVQAVESGVKWEPGFRVSPCDRRAGPRSSRRARRGLPGRLDGSRRLTPVPQACHTAKLRAKSVCTLPQRPCRVCGTMFQPLRRAQCFCSTPCRARGWRRQQETARQVAGLRAAAALLLREADRIEAASGPGLDCSPGVSRAVRQQSSGRNVGDAPHLQPRNRRMLPQ
jgi:hypothetical protein